jgi:hypothetical protein
MSIVVVLLVLVVHPARIGPIVQRLATSSSRWQEEVQLRLHRKQWSVESDCYSQYMSGKTAGEMLLLAEMPTTFVQKLR